ncbi:DUF4065 domain-containing protein [Lachnospiraceae bacterium]|nr:DUF4065 domain-containing protein [Lachnospiraceae bacterium]
MKKYCEECGRDVETKVISRKETYEVCGERIEVDAKVLVCAGCGEEFFCEELDNATLVKAYNEYRRRHKLLFPDEIKKIRVQYGFSQRSFAKLLNWGDKTVHRYENGSIQDKAHNSLLLFLRNPENMRIYLTENEVMLDDNQKEKLLKTVDKLEQDSEYHAGNKLVNLFFSEMPSVENGFKPFDYEKFCAMVLFFAKKSAGLLKVKLLKLLNYSDFVFYRENGISISGARYVHLPYGPVPKNYDLLFGMMEADEIAHIEVEFDNGYEKHQVIPDSEISEGVLSESELSVLERIYEKFADFGSAEISNYSHREKGYTSTKQGEVISYSFAKDIRLD